MLCRRKFLALAGASVASRPLAAAGWSAGGAATADRPNVLFIATDDLAATLGCYGHRVAKTPNLDRLAARGVRMLRAYSQFALCSPSRSSLMTGLAPDTTTVYDLQRHFRTALPQVTTLSQCFAQNGYFTARVGKIYHYGNPGQIGTNGLDDAPSWMERYNPKGVDKDEEPLVENLTPGRGLGSAIAFHASSAPDALHTDGLVAQQTIALMEQHRDRPFFLAAGFYRPHCPYIAPKAYFDQYPAQTLEPYQLAAGETEAAPPWAYFTNPPNWNLDREQQQRALQAYYASVSFVDANVGRLLDALERLGLTEKTIVVFWSDHGYALGEHGQWMKQTVFEAATRIPLLLAGPGITAKGKACARTVEMLDFYPTLADLAGLRQVPAGLHGVSLRPLLRNPKAEWPRPAVSQVRRTRQGKTYTGYSIRNERYRFTEWNDGQDGEELYDYQRQPEERQNLAGEAKYANIKQSLRRQLRSISRQRGRKVAAEAAG